MRGGFALMAMCLALGAGMPADPRERPLGRRDDEPRLSPQRVPCPRCRAGAGEACDRKTLGRQTYHMARVEALDAREGEEQS